MSQIRERTLVIARHYGHLVDMVRGGAFPDLGARDLDSVFIEVMVDERQMIIDGVAEQLGYTSQVEEGKADAQEHALVTYEDGAQIVEITGMEALKREGLRMVHCIGDRTYGHPQKLEEGKTRAFSYRDPTGKPRATVTVFKRTPLIRREGGGFHTKQEFPTDQNQGPHNGPIHDVDARHRLSRFLLELRGEDPDQRPDLGGLDRGDLNRLWPQRPTWRNTHDPTWIFSLIDGELAAPRGETERATWAQEVEDIQDAFSDLIVDLLWAHFPEVEANINEATYRAVASGLGRDDGLGEGGLPWHLELAELLTDDPTYRALMLRLQKEIS